MNLEREQTHKQLNYWTPTGTWPGLKFCEHKYLLSEFSVCKVISDMYYQNHQAKTCKQVFRCQNTGISMHKKHDQNCAAACKCQSLATKADLEKHRTAYVYS